MALTFPSSPTNGQVYTDTTSGNRYIYDSTRQVWKYSSNNVGMSVSSTPPGNVGPGSMWYNKEIGRTFLYYDDGDSQQWVETVPAPGSFDSTTVSSYANSAASQIVGSAFTVANAAYTTANNAYIVANASFNAANTKASTGKAIAMAIVFGG